MSDERNVLDKYKQWEHDLIVDALRDDYTGIELLMINLEGDFNFGSVVRNANNFGVSRVFYVGKKKWDKRSAVGTHHYTEVVHVGTTEEDALNWLDSYGRGYARIVLDNNTELNPIMLPNFEWPVNPLLIVGSESEGVPRKIQDWCDALVEIPSYGSVRSLNVATATGIALYDYTSKKMTER